MSKILVVAAHPDDEILGVGATIAKRVAAGDEAWTLIMAEGQTSRWTHREDAGADVISNLHKNTFEAADVIGYKEVFFGDMPDNRMDSCDLLDIVKCVEGIIEKIQPDIIYTHHSGDLNIDHQLTNRAVLTATRPIGNYCVKKVLGFETVSSTEWNYGSKEAVFYPNVYEEVAGFLNIKLDAMKKYQSELCEFPHPRSLKMLDIRATYWGSTVGLHYVEAFELIREVIGVS